MSATGGYPAGDRAAEDLAPPPAGPAPGGARPRLSELGQAELIRGAVQDLRAVATAIEAERSQVNECLADPGEAWRHRAIHVARELAFQADKIRDRVAVLEQVADDINRSNGRA